MEKMHDTYYYIMPSKLCKTKDLFAATAAINHSDGQLNILSRKAGLFEDGPHLDHALHMLFQVCKSYVLTAPSMATSNLKSSQYSGTGLF
jgi:hypothetical protein